MALARTRTSKCLFRTIIAKSCIEHKKIRRGTPWLQLGEFPVTLTGTFPDLDCPCSCTNQKKHSYLYFHNIVVVFFCRYGILIKPLNWASVIVQDPYNWPSFSLILREFCSITTSLKWDSTTCFAWGGTRSFFQLQQGSLSNLEVKVVVSYIDSRICVCVCVCVDPGVCVCVCV